MGSLGLLPDVGGASVAQCECGRLGVGAGRSSVSIVGFGVAAAGYIGEASKEDCK